MQQKNRQPQQEPPKKQPISLATKKRQPVEVLLEDADVVVEVLPRLGKHTVQAQQLMDGDSTKYFPVLMHLLVRHEGTQFPVEEFLEMSGKDYDALLVAISGE